MSDQTPDIWLEFEWSSVDNTTTDDDDAFNMQIRLHNGKKYALNVWTFKALERFHQTDTLIGDNMSGRYLIPPDLLVERLDRQIIEQIVTDIIRRKQLKDEWLVENA
jgi:hypothetical protein